MSIHHKEQLIDELEEHLKQVKECILLNPLSFMDRCDLWNVLIQTGGYGIWKEICEPKLGLQEYADLMLELR